jgi:hypothetical protein
VSVRAPDDGPGEDILDRAECKRVVGLQGRVESHDLPLFLDQQVAQGVERLFGKRLADLDERPPGNAFCLCRLNISIRS